MVHGRKCEKLKWWVRFLGEEKCGARTKVQKVKMVGIIPLYKEKLPSKPDGSEHQFSSAGATSVGSNFTFT